MAHRISRRLRCEMRADKLAGVPLYPEFRNCPAPSAPRILEIFNDVQRHRLMSGDAVVQIFEPQLTALQHKVLDLLHVPAAAYLSHATSGSQR